MIMSPTLRKMNRTSLATNIALKSVSPTKNLDKKSKLKEILCHCKTGRACTRDGCEGFAQRRQLVRAIKQYRAEGHATRENHQGYEKLDLFDATCSALADEWLFLRYGIPTFKTVNHRRDILIKETKKKDQKPLPRCHEEQPCQLGACPVCKRLHQLQLLAGFYLTGSHLKKWRTITIIPEYGQSELGKQPLGGLRKFAKRLKDSLEETAPRMKGIFVIETSIDRKTDGTTSCQWHVHGLMRSLNKSEYAEIKKRFAWKRGSCKAVRQSKAEDAIGWLGYASKSEIFSRNYSQAEEPEAFSKSVANLTQEACVAEALQTRRVHRRLIVVGMDEFKAVLA